jgi:predicted dinucleotide-binding enzyme
MSRLRSTVLTRRPAVVNTAETPIDKLHKAERAKMLLDDDMLVAAFDQIEMDHIEAALSATDDESRRRATDRANAVRDVRRLLDGVINEAERATRERINLP